MNGWPVEAESELKKLVLISKERIRRWLRGYHSGLGESVAIYRK
jgi:hypothetical protein